MRLSVRYLPSWVPGGRFKRDAAKWNKAGASMYAKPLEMVEEALVSITFSSLLSVPDRCINNQGRRYRAAFSSRHTARKAG